MTVQAFAAYIQSSAERQGRTQASLAEAAGVEANYLWRLQRGQIKKPSAEVIAALIQAVDGDFEKAMLLLLDPNSKENDGHVAAVADTDLLARKRRMLIRSLSDENLKHLIALLTRIEVPDELGQGFDA